MPNPYPAQVQKIAQVLLEEIEKHFPGATKKNYDSLGYPCRKELDEGSPAQQRAEMCIYIELMKAGVFNGQFGYSSDDRGLHEQGVEAQSVGA